MKKIKFFAIALAGLSVAFVSSCKKGDEDTEKPKIFFDPASPATTVKVGDSVMFDVVFSDNDEVKSYSAVKAVGSLSVDLEKGTNKGTSYTMKAKFVAMQADANSSVVYKFSVTDAADNTEEKSITFNVTSNPPQKATPVTDLILDAQARTAPIMAFLDADKPDNPYDYAELDNPKKDEIDIVYAYGQSLANILGAPNSDPIKGALYTIVNSWSVKNNTLFLPTTYTGAEFDAAFGATAKTDELARKLEWSTATNYLGGILQGKVYAFKTVDGKYGLIKTTAIGTSDQGQLTCNLLVTE